ncbi:MAG TPA: hypothetical protein VGE35_01350 [Candidatus Paceibacterota bacterium]
MNSIRTTNVLLIICLIGIVYLLFFTHIVVPRAIAQCSMIAMSLEDKVDGQDVSEYIKNTVSCLTSKI